MANEVAKLLLAIEATENLANKESEAFTSVAMLLLSMVGFLCHLDMTDVPKVLELRAISLAKRRPGISPDSYTTLSMLATVLSRTSCSESAREGIKRCLLITIEELINQE